MCSFKLKQVIITLKIYSRLFWNFCYLNHSWNCSTFSSFSQLLSPPLFPPLPPLTSFFLTQLSVSFTLPLPLSCSLSCYSSLCLSFSLSLTLYLTFLFLPFSIYLYLFLFLLLSQFLPYFAPFLFSFFSFRISRACLGNFLGCEHPVDRGNGDESQ